MKKGTIYHIPVCPFSQRLEILLSLKGCQEEIEFCVIDITVPYPEWLLEKAPSTTTLPILETPEGYIIKESMIIMQYLDELFAGCTIAKTDPYQHAVECMLAGMEGDFCNHGYTWVMNQNLEQRVTLKEGMLRQYEELNNFLVEYSPNGPFLFEEFGWAETVFAPLFMRFWFLEYYEDFKLPVSNKFNRVQKWIDACISHKAVQQVTKEEIIKLYYDYAKGAGNGELLAGRTKSSFVFEPHWRTRPMPPKSKYEYSATDEELGLLADLK